MTRDELLVHYNIHKPQRCEKCGCANPEYKGVGEYRCVECGFVMYDDFGLVRNYLEANNGATQSQIHQATGVSMDTIRYFLKEERLEIAAGSRTFLRCEICNAEIRSGRYCLECARKVQKMKDEEKNNKHKDSMAGYGKVMKGEDGARRFKR